ncbi:MAG: MerR family transcriptional regulator [Muribaculaceae bacterium]|nr:MerR family transcriptional regulator [Muribaculaceae bacterium]
MATENIDKKYYKISEVAEIIGVPQSTLRFWESQFAIVSPKRNAKGTRFYTPKDLERLKMIYYLLKTKGLHIEAAREALRTNREGLERQSRAVERLRSVRATLVEMLDALHKLR